MSTESQPLPHQNLSRCVGTAHVTWCVLLVVGGIYSCPSTARNILAVEIGMEHLSVNLAAPVGVTHLLIAVEWRG